MLCKKELKRLLFGKDTVVFFVILLVVSLIIFSDTSSTHSGFLAELNQPEFDLSHETLEGIVKGFSWHSYMLDYFYNDKLTLLLIIFLGCFGIKFSDYFVKHVMTGIGNQLRARITASTYVKQYMSIQALYILIFNLVSFTIILFIIRLIGGAPEIGVERMTTYGIIDSFLGVPLDNTLMYIVYYYSNVLLFSSYLIFIVWIGSFVGYLSRSQVIAKLFPCASYFIILIIASSVGNVLKGVSHLFNFVIADVYIGGLTHNYTVFSPYVIGQIILIAISILILYRVSIYKMEYQYV
ncbi:hypothetical protein [Turicibacter sp. TJ11]|uniref:hypothetical protein n=1 Tax=Turicibacter sp. TJ11 TaxID=2806443 RepID=UPI001F21F338|nr:hypothetical protein [Turicibacter sp. TJ11]